VVEGPDEVPKELLARYGATMTRMTLYTPYAASAAEIAAAVQTDHEDADDRTAEK
jgi:hypothetical protein